MSYDIKSFSARNSSLVTVLGSGYDAYDIQSFIEKGVKVIIGKPFSSSEIKSFLNKNYSRVIVLDAGFDKTEVTSFIALGATVIANIKRVSDVFMY